MWKDATRTEMRDEEWRKIKEKQKRDEMEMTDKRMEKRISGNKLAKNA
jgi:hypothetical protein